MKIQKHLVNLLQREKAVSVLFASPSAVEIFAEEVAPHIGWDGYTIGAIGHVTERALKEVGAPVHVRPEYIYIKGSRRKIGESKGCYVWIN